LEGKKTFTGISNSFLLVFFKNFVLSAVYFGYLIKGKSWPLLTDFNKICYHSYRIFDNEERSATADTQPNDLFTVKMCHHMPQSNAGQPSFVEA